MKNKLTLLLVAMLVTASAFAQEKSKTEVLLIIDEQYFYFPGGKSELVNPIPAAENTQKILLNFRQEKKPVIFIKHKFEPGGDIYELVKPVEDEKVIVKTDVNSFKGTDLERMLMKNRVVSK